MRGFFPQTKDRETTHTPQHIRSKPHPAPQSGPYLLSLLDSVQVYLQYVALQPTNKQSAVVSQEEAVHILTLIQPEEKSRQVRGSPAAMLRPSCNRSQINGKATYK